MSSSTTPVNIQQQQSFVQDEQPVDNVNSMPSATLDPNTPGSLPSTPPRGALSSSPPVTPESELYSTNPCTNRALVSSPISATPKRPYGPFNPTPAASPNSAVSTPVISPVPASQSSWVPLVMPYHWPRPGWTPAPVFGPPTPPGMTPSEQEDFEHDRARRIWQAVIRDEQEYHRWQHHVLIRRMRRVEGLARIRRNERRIQELLAAQQEAQERAINDNAPGSAPASAPAPVPVPSVPVTPASVNRRRATKKSKKSTLSREIKSLAQLGGARNTVSLGKRKRDTDDNNEEDANLDDQTPGTRARSSPMREDTVPGVWAGRLRPRVAKQEDKNCGKGGSGESKSGGRRKRKDMK